MENSDDAQNETIFNFAALLLQGVRLYRYDFYRGLEHVMEDDLDEMYHAFVGINILVFLCVSDS